ncbi:hypothetical protein K450DRAFT_219097 [Umbelopsis ramanniana AG]|uniref:FHA domain-containing protein n=1 Tax=Umbelopsis ramanniana AG TaxID=1314678 RepID=A0AAD5HJG1_UMBRA|nr:uncharacterized protein K450DRAFT_219097 [Umbelopsis ramanniana AG]KAI8584283.1 hypothetical protein K450DRAFT_219097 [Umbelopsis ramanniana AG]
METTSAPTTPQRVKTHHKSQYDSENLSSAKGLLDSSPITSKVYYRNETPLTPIRTPLKDSNNLSSPSQFATSPLVKQEPSPAQNTRIQNTVQSPTTITGSYIEKVTVGRCSAATHQVGRRNRLLSRIHLSISWNEASSQFELTVLGLNGLKVDEKPCTQKETVVLEDGSIIDIVGEVVQFNFPPSEQDELSLADDSSVFDIKTPLSPAISVGQDSLEEQQPISNNHSSNALSQKLMAAMAESKEEKQLATIPEAVVENTKPAEELVVEEVNQITTIKESLDDEQKEDPVEHVHGESVPLEIAPVQHDVKEEQVNREGSQDINIEVAESSDAEPAVTESEQTDPMNADANYAEMIIEALVFSRKSSMPISDIYTRIMTTNPAYKMQSRKLWLDTITSVLHENDFFGQITRKGKTADGTPKENLYYYRSDKDPVEWRQATYTQVGRSARKCTLQDKQYFWKIPPKLGRNRSSYVPPPAGSSATEGKRGRSNKQEDDEENGSAKRIRKRKVSEEEDVVTKENTTEK